MTRTRASLAVICCALLWAPAAHGRAQTSGETQPVSALTAAQKQHHAAVRAFALGDYRQAIALFAAADQLLPNAAYSFNIAKAYEALGDAPHALGFYRDYLRRAGSPPDTSQVIQRIQALAARLDGQAVQQVTSSTAPSRARATTGRAPVGTSRLTPAAPPTSVAVPTPRSTPTPTPAPVSGSGLRTAGFVTLGAGAAALGSGLIFEIMRANTESKAMHQTEQTRFAEELDSMRSQQTLARVFAGAGAVLAALGGVLLVVDFVASEHESGERLAFACQPSACHATLTGVF